MKSIASQVEEVHFDDVKFLGRLTNWYRVMREAGLLYDDLQTPIDDSEMRVRLVQFWKGVSGTAPSALEPAVPAYPKVGEVFELTLDGDAPENQPLEMVRRFGYDPTGWKHKGPKIAGKQTRYFKLVQTGHCPNLNAVREKLKVHGENEGQWIVAFKAKYQQPDGQGPIGVADPSWTDPDGYAFFPCVDTDGRLYFRWAGYGQGDGWRWLVPAEQVIGT